MKTVHALSIVLLSTVALWQAYAEGPTPAPAALERPCAESPHRILDQLDTRRPVSMPPQMALHHKQNMQDHLLVMQEITAALANDDFPSIERSVTRIGYSEQTGGMCDMMGAQTPGFSQQAVNFHRTADSIGEAARHKDHQGVLKAMSATLSTCVGCHATFRQQVVTGGMGGHPGMGPMHGGAGGGPGKHGGGSKPAESTVVSP